MKITDEKKVCKVCGGDQGRYDFDPQGCSCNGPAANSRNMLHLAVSSVLEADTEFRKQMMPGWEGDPLSDEIDGLRRVFTAALAGQTQQGVEEYSHEDRIALAGCLSWDLNEISPEDVKGILERLRAEGYSLTRSALVDVPAVESEPVAWQTMDSAPTDGTEIIAAERWERTGKVRVRVYKYDGHPNYWHCREDGVCIRPEYQSRYVWTPVPAALSTRKGSAGDGAATGTKGCADV